MWLAVEYRTAGRTNDVREAGRLTAHVERQRRHLLVTETAFDRRSQLESTTFRAQHPRPQLERRLVPHVPLMPAGELGHPDAGLVRVEAKDCPLHSASVRPTTRTQASPASLSGRRYRRRVFSSFTSSHRSRAALDQMSSR